MSAPRMGGGMNRFHLAVSNQLQRRPLAWGDESYET